MTLRVMLALLGSLLVAGCIDTPEEPVFPPEAELRAVTPPPGHAPGVIQLKRATVKAK
jgi:hypothetical protein